MGYRVRTPKVLRATEEMVRKQNMKKAYSDRALDSLIVDKIQRHIFHAAYVISSDVVKRIREMIRGLGM